MRYIHTLAALALSVVPIVVAAPVRADDPSDARTVITQQLQAFRADDAAEAYGLAAPNIQRIFPSPEIFLRMVARGYPPVYRSQGATFEPLRTDGGVLRQDVRLNDSSGQGWIASYTLERQTDGALRITGCSLRKSDDVGA